MNRYPLWKYVVIVLALVFSTLYALPNLFGEAPALQISRSSSNGQINPNILTEIENALQKQKLSYQSLALEKNSIRIKFAHPEEQLKAKDVLEHRLGESYVIALNLLPNSPDWLTNIHALPMYLGLDLRGGVHFLLQVDMQKALEKAGERYTGDVRSLLREKKVNYAGLSKLSVQSIEVKFAQESDLQNAEKEITKAFPELSLKPEAGRLLIQLGPELQKRIQEMSLQQNITTLRNRVNELGVAEPIIQQQGMDRVVVQLPGVQDTAKAKEILGRTASLEIRLVDDEHDVRAAVVDKQIPFGSQLFYDRNGLPLLVKKQVTLTGEYISDAQPGMEQQTQQAAVHVTLDGRGARIFQQVTRDNVNKRMAILLVEKKLTEVITAPVIREEIGGGRVQITGMSSMQEATDVALLLRAGALAAPMSIIEERTLGPSLGAENITKGINSTLVGFAAVALVMIVYYRVFGTIGTIALFGNVLLLIAILSMLQATLTLPGIAGIALTIGMAIDANVLINERIREELRNGSTPYAAIHAGYERAFDTILDSNITTFIAGIALFWLGSGPVRGFAVTLCIGILTSMFSAIMYSRAMVNLVYNGKKRIDSLSV